MGADNHGENNTACNGEWINDCPWPVCACSKKIYEDRINKLTPTEKPKLSISFNDEYHLGDVIRKAFLKHGNNSWTSVAKEVIRELKNKL